MISRIRADRIVARIVHRAGTSVPLPGCSSARPSTPAKPRPSGSRSRGPCEVGGGDAYLMRHLAVAGVGLVYAFEPEIADGAGAVLSAGRATPSEARAAATRFRCSCGGTEKCIYADCATAGTAADSPRHERHALRTGKGIEHDEPLGHRRQPLRHPLPRASHGHLEGARPLRAVAGRD